MDQAAADALALAKLRGKPPEEQLAAMLVLFQDMFSKRLDSLDIDKLSWLSAGVASSDYALRNMQAARRFADASALLRFALSQAPADGLRLEFGVYSGKTIKEIAFFAPGSPVHGFDSFEGLPEAWRPGFPKGMFATGELPDVPKNVTLVKGLFDRTLPPFCDRHRGAKAAFIHVDCDLHSSTQTVLSQLRDFIVPGTVIVFDEYFNYPGWQDHEARALREFCEANRVAYSYIGLVPQHQQVAIRILG